MVKVPVSFEEQLESLLSEGGEGARRREQAVAENLQDLEESGVVLFGAGNLGMRTLAGLRSPPGETGKTLHDQAVRVKDILKPLRCNPPRGNAYLLCVHRAGVGDGEIRQSYRLPFHG